MIPQGTDFIHFTHVRHEKDEEDSRCMANKQWSKRSKSQRNVLQTAGKRRERQEIYMYMYLRTHLLLLSINDVPTSK